MNHDFYMSIDDILYHFLLMQLSSAMKGPVTLKDKALTNHARNMLSAHILHIGIIGHHPWNGSPERTAAPGPEDTVPHRAVSTPAQSVEADRPGS